MYNVYQHWDPLKVCVVGKSYPPEFYSWITKPAVRSLFEKIAIETEEDYQVIIKKLKSFGVEVLRPNLPANSFVNGQFVMPPMTPRDDTVMIGETFYSKFNWHEASFEGFYNNVKDTSWPECDSIEKFYHLPKHIRDECIQVHNMHKFLARHKNINGNNSNVYQDIFDHVTSIGNRFVEGADLIINGAMVTRIGRDLYFGTKNYVEDPFRIIQAVEKEFPDNRTHVVNTGGHSDGTYCPVCPGLIISLYDVPTYADTFPDWEVVYLPAQGFDAFEDFMDLKAKNKGKWWIPGFEKNQDVIDTVETWLGHWTGYVEETVFDVNMLIIDPKNVMVFNYNKQVFDALEKYGITPHIVPFRHRYFWDGGIHCVTTDLHREGGMQDYFPQRG